WRCSRSCSAGVDMEPPATTVERDGRAAVVHLHGDLVVSRMREIYVALRAVARLRDVAVVVLDFSDAGRGGSAGVAAIGLIGRQLADSGKQLDLEHLREQHRAALALVPEPAEQTEHADRLDEQVALSAASRREQPQPRRWSAWPVPGKQGWPGWPR